ncbi:MAG: hypothetical protein EA369_07280 [Bradymonadales bacterium]|nr:MAG: hypothetical protein EA369_07280 [Bradymonadales bacterium]
MTFGLSGLGSGINWRQLIDTIIRADEESVARTLGRREVLVNVERTVFSNLQGAMTGLRTSIQALNSTGNFRTKTVTSSDPSIVTASATNSASVQSAKVEVLSLATQAQARMKFASTDAVVHEAAGNAEITLKVRGVERKLEVPTGTTLSQLAELINSSNMGVRATVYNTNDGTDTPARLSLTDNQLGTWTDPSAEGDEDSVNIEFVDFSSVLDQVDEDPEYIPAEQTVVKINGEEVRRNNHSITDVLPGMTLSLRDAKPGTTVTLSVNESTGNALSAMKRFVESYNEVINILRSSLRVDLSEEVQSNPTAGNSTLRGILTQLQAAVTRPIDSGGLDSMFSSMTDLGITSVRNTTDPSKNGHLQLNEALFNAAINTDFDGVIDFLEGALKEDGQRGKGFADKMGDLMTSFLASETGSITSTIKSLDSTLRRVSADKIKRVEQINAKEKRLVERFARLESQLAGLNQQQNTLDSALNSLNQLQTFISRRGKG